VGFSTNKKLSRGNATIDHRSVGVDGIGSHWFIPRMHVQGRIQRLVSFLECSTHGHACELSSMLKDPCQIVGQGLQMDRVNSLMKGSRAMLLLSKAVIVFALINHSFSPKQLQTQVVVGLKQVDNTESFNSRISRILFNHYCHQCTPTFWCKPVLDWHVQ
jgi:hypothetical protein